MARTYGSRQNPQTTPITFTESVQDVDGDSFSISMILESIDDGTGFSAVNTDISDLPWVSFTTSSSKSQDVENAEVDVNIDPAGPHIGKTYRFNITADDGTDKLTIQRDVSITKEAPLITSGENPVATWNDSSTEYTNLSPSSEASALINADITNGDSGVIMEAGATGTGMALWTDGSTLYFACGNGSGTGSSSERVWIETSMPTGSALNIEWAASETNGRAELYVDGNQVGADTFNNRGIAGTDGGGIARQHGGGIRDLEGGIGTNSNWDGTFNGPVEIYDKYLN